MRFTFVLSRNTSRSGNMCLYVFCGDVLAGIWMPQLLYLDTSQVGCFYKDVAWSVVFCTATAEHGVLVPYQNNRLVVSSGFFG